LFVAIYGDNSKGAAVVDDTAKVIGSNAEDLQHYFVWIDLADVDIEPSE
jgi:hypothetical protein